MMRKASFRRKGKSAPEVYVNKLGSLSAERIKRMAPKSRLQALTQRKTRPKCFSATEKVPTVTKTFLALMLTIFLQKRLINLRRNLICSKIP